MPSTVSVLLLDFLSRNTVHSFVSVPDERSRLGGGEEGDHCLWKRRPLSGRQYPVEDIKTRSVVSIFFIFHWIILEHRDSKLLYSISVHFCCNSCQWNLCGSALDSPIPCTRKISATGSSLFKTVTVLWRFCAFVLPRLYGCKESGCRELNHPRLPVGFSRILNPFFHFSFIISISCLPYLCLCCFPQFSFPPDSKIHNNSSIKSPEILLFCSGIKRAPFRFHWIYFPPFFEFKMSRTSLFHCKFKVFPSFSGGNVSQLGKQPPESVLTNVSQETWSLEQNSSFIVFSCTYFDV